MAVTARRMTVDMNARVFIAVSIDYQFDVEQIYAKSSLNLSVERALFQLHMNGSRLSGTYVSSIVFGLLLSLGMISCSNASVSIESIDKKAEALRQEILQTKDLTDFQGRVFYASSSEGDDANDGLSPERAVRTLRRVCELETERGDAVLFRRGDVFRGHVKTRPGVTYAAYGKGEKPRLYGSPFNAATEGEWTLTDKENIWAYSEPLFNDVGTLVLDDSQAAFKVMMVRMDDGSTTHIDTGAPFAGYKDLDRDLDFYHDYKESGLIYLCSKENPSARFHSIELLEKGHVMTAVDDVRVDNLTIMYCGSHGIGSGTTSSLEVTNCVFGWIGGSIQGEALFGRRNPTRYGNAIEIYGGCGHYLVDHCWIYQVYDAGITHQFSSGGMEDIIQKDVTYRDNLVEDCVYAIEFFLGKADSDSADRYMEGILIEDNILRRAGYGWGSQRPDKGTPAILKSWGHWNKASDFIVRNNIFDRSTFNLLNVSADEKEWLPLFEGNTYVQDKGGKGGEMGVGNKPYPFDEAFPAVLSELYQEESGNFLFLE